MSENGQITERLRLLLKTVTIKEMHGLLRAGFASYHMYLTVHGIGKASAGREVEDKHSVREDSRPN